MAPRGNGPRQGRRRLIRHARPDILQLDESPMTQCPIGQILGRIERLAWHPT